MRHLLKSYTVLYAEDEIALQSKIAKYLQGYFKEVYTVVDGKEALKLYNIYKPDALILDINMPILSGLEVAKKIREKDSNTRIVMLTAHTEKEILLQATEIDMSRYLVKPIDPHEFKTVLDKLGFELAQNSTKVVKFDFEHVWHKESRTMIKNGEIVDLKENERRLIELLVKRRQSYATIEEIMAYLWEDNLDMEVSRDSVKTLVNMLRKKIPRESIQNVYGKGYRLNI